MSTGGGLIAQAASTDCELCDRGNECEFKCVQCEEAMCDECKTTHLRSKATREHTITTLKELIPKPKPDKDEENEASEAYCSVHTSELILMYCEECSTPVCVDCISGDHKKHDIIKMNSVLEKKKQEMADIASTARIKLTKLKENIEKLHNNRDAFHREKHDVIATIQHQGQILKETIDDIVQSFVNELEKEGDETQKHFVNTEDKIKQDISGLETMIAECQISLHSRTVVSIVKSVDDKKRILSQIESSDPEAIHPTKFAVGEINNAYIRSTIGYFKNNANADTNRASNKPSNSNDEQSRRSSNADNATSRRSIGHDDTSRCQSNHAVDTCEYGLAQVEPSASSYKQPHYNKAIFVTSFKSPSNADCIVAKGNTHVWTGHRCVGDEAVLIHISGKSKQKLKLNFKLGDLAVAPSGDLFATVGFNGHHIKKLLKNDSFENIADMAPFYTEGIHITPENEILICLYNGTTNEGNVVRMTCSGKIVKETQRDSYNRALFKYPQLVSQNTNKDICVVDYTNSSVAQHTLVVVDKNENPKFRYTGRSDLNKKTRFSIYGVTCDKYGCILVSDNGNHQIHYLNQNGQFLQFILNSLDSIKQPRGLTIDEDGKLWICNKRDIMVFQLNL